MKMRNEYKNQANLTKINDFDEKPIPDFIPIENIIQVGFIDLETTGLDNQENEIVELFLRIVNVNKENGEIYNTHKLYHSYNEPKIKIPPEMTRIHGITNEMVKGKKIDWVWVNTLFQDCLFILAHNAPFDRGFIEVNMEYSKEKIWICTKNLINWKDEEISNTSQEIIACHLGFFYDAHSAKNDVDNLINIMRQPSLNKTKNYMKMILDLINEEYYRINITGTKFPEKSFMNQLNLKWDGTGWHGLYNKDKTNEIDKKLTEFYKGIDRVNWNIKKVKLNELFPSQRIKNR